MAQTPDRTLDGEIAWLEALAREAVIRPLAFIGTLNAAERASACGQLGLRSSDLSPLSVEPGVGPGYGFASS
ncbi:hypothetical protein GGQ65_007064 [Rhizobium fabae]|uniref:Uncharacterized protein n=1 Tax=Rhizobium fabae TaxID=573179 RepID=A0A7W6FMZ8_9HYPH|nr:hypothetical protein [Rhizobium fabae]